MAYVQELQVGMTVIVKTKINKKTVQFLGSITSIKRDLEYGVFVSAEDNEETWAWVRPSDVFKYYD